MAALAAAGAVATGSLTAAVLALTTAGLAGGSPATTARAADRARPDPSRIVVYRLPLAGAPAVVRPFEPPVTRYGPGHLGVDLRATDGALVLAAGAGTVRFAGSVAGRGVVVVAHADGIRTEYEPVAPAVRTGTVVRAGQLIGRVTGRHPGCPGRCLHWGARLGTSYLDPLTLLHRLAPVRLLPWSAGRVSTQARG